MSPGVADVARGVVLDGRYRIEDVIGHGGMATVYRAHDEMLGRDVAVKLFRPTPDRDETLRHQAEMRMLARLSHPNLVTLHDAGSSHAGGPTPQSYLVMELVPGPTLADLLTTGPLTGRQAARVGRQLAEALATVHAAGVVHRDIKPANVLLLQREQAEPEEHPDAHTTGPLVKIADFGIARLTDGARLTMTGTTMGTATYLSPEQASGREVGPPTDVYALGLVLLECLTGHKAFTGTVMEVAAARLTSDPVIPTALGRAWCEVLAAMTRRDPAARPTMAEIAVHLAELTDADGSTVPTGASRTDDDPTGDVPTAAQGVVGPSSGSDASRPGTGTGTGTGTEDAEDAHAVTRPLRTSRILALARTRVRPGAAEISSNGDDPAPSPPPAFDELGPSGPSRPGLTAILALTTVALLIAVGVLVSRSGDAPAPPPSYPAVEGDLGTAIDELTESVVP